MCVLLIKIVLQSEAFGIILQLQTETAILKKTSPVPIVTLISCILPGPFFPDYY